MFSLTGEISGISKLKGPTIFYYKELKAATKSFSEENKLGEGGFGAVYKVTIYFIFDIFI